MSALPLFQVMPKRSIFFVLVEKLPISPATNGLVSVALCIQPPSNLVISFHDSLTTPRSSILLSKAAKPPAVNQLPLVLGVGVNSAACVKVYWLVTVVEAKEE